MDKNVFRRVETKYLLKEEEYDLLMQMLENKIIKDKYYFSTICNLYLDTDDFLLAMRSIDKPAYKEKVRIRSYSVPNLDTKVFFEVKKKYKGIVGKRRVSAKLSEIYEYFNENKNLKCEKQIMNEIEYLFKIYDLKPKAFIAYDRYSYRGIDDEKFRITIDTNLRGRLEDLKLESGDYGEKILENYYCIMEVKTLDTYPKWFVDILSSLKIYPKSFSKYGSLYKTQVLKIGV